MAVRGIGEIALGDVRITDGHVSFKNGVTGTTETADAINLKIGLPNLDAPLTVDGSVHWRDKPVQLTLNAAKPRALLDGSGSDVKLNLAADPIKLTFAGTLAVAGALRARATSISRFRRFGTLWLGPPASP